MHIPTWPNVAFRAQTVSTTRRWQARRSHGEEDDTEREHERRPTVTQSRHELAESEQA